MAFQSSHPMEFCASCCSFLLFSEIHGNLSSISLIHPGLDVQPLDGSTPAHYFRPWDDFEKFLSFFLALPSFLQLLSFCSALEASRFSLRSEGILPKTTSQAISGPGARSSSQDRGVLWGFVGTEWLRTGQE